MKKLTISEDKKKEIIEEIRRNDESKLDFRSNMNTDSHHYPLFYCFST